MNAAKKPQPDTDAVIDEIVERVAAYRHHPKFRRAVVEAKNLVAHYLDDHNLKRLGAHDQDLVERIACAIHSARIERGY
jgi:hypothetical protein